MLTPSCAPPTCCSGSYGARLWNTASGGVDVVLRWKVWNCVNFETETCTAMPSRDPDSTWCRTVTIPANTECGDDFIDWTSINIPCSCSQSGRGSHIVVVEMWSGCSTPFDCGDLVTDCTSNDDVECKRQSNLFCIETGLGLQCCCS